MPWHADLITIYMIKTPFLDAYRALECVPTRQDISDLDAHFHRRNALLRTLGIIPSHLSDKRIIEFGPGSGENSIFLASLRPERYTLVDGTKSSIRSVEAYRRKYYSTVNTELVHSDFFDYQSCVKFDAVFCEGAIPTQSEPERLLKHISDFVDVGGVLVITCVDAVSFLPEAIRRLLARIFIGRAKLTSNDTLPLLSFFKLDLDSLDGMSRRREDWVFDQIIHPWSGPPFAMDQAIAVLAESFSPQGTSPRFFNDWRWYKAVCNSNDRFSDLLCHSYLSNVHNLLDYRITLPEAGVEKNRFLMKKALEIYKSIFLIERGEAAFDCGVIISLLSEITERCTHLDPLTIRSIKDSIQLLKTGLAASSDLSNWWGRGQQYLSFVRMS